MMGIYSWMAVLRCAELHCGGASRLRQRANWESIEREMHVGATLERRLACKQFAGALANPGAGSREREQHISFSNYLID